MTYDDYRISNLADIMSTEDIQGAWVDIQGAWEILRDACENRLEELEYDEDTYEDGSNEEIDQVLEVWEQLENVSF